MKTKKLYMKPVIERAVVELEGGFCASIENHKDAKVETTGHEVREATVDQLGQWNDTEW